MDKTIRFTTVSFAAWLCAFAYFGRYATYIADDFCTAAAVKHQGIFASQASRYQNWSGRYSYSFVMALVQSLGSWWLPLTAATIISFVVMGLYIALRGRVQHPFPLSLAITTLALASALDLGQLIYWPTGAATYPISLPLFALAVHFLTRKNMAAAAILVFLNAGFSETFAAVQVCVLILLASCVPQFRRLWLFALLVAIAGAVIVATAPGNAVRAAQLPPTPNWLATLSIAFHAMATVTRTWVTAKWIQILGAALLGMAWPQRPSKQLVLVSGLCLAAITVATFVPSAWAMSEAPPARALFIFTTAAILFTGVAAGAIRVRDRAFPAVMAFALILGSFAPARVVYTYARKLNSYRQYDADWHAQDVYLRSSSRRAMILPLRGTSLVNAIEEPTRDAHHFANRCIAAAYDLDSVEVPSAP